jgi:hypothetical protein
MTRPLAFAYEGPEITHTHSLGNAKVLSTRVGITVIDVGPTQQIVESADPVPL